MFSCSDYNKLYAMVDWLLGIFLFYVTCIYITLLFEEYDCRYALQYWRKYYTVIYCY